MARKSQHTFSKRQREQKKAEKAAQKRARRAASKDGSLLLQETDGGEAPVGEPDGEPVGETVEESLKEPVKEDDVAKPD